ncbi:AI-2E family transporter [Streptomonospora sp. S1-112]|uniref:AI-2E family transporter n=1 Tax=Streptomonospora mangrovi TaxID=2883123 RepID=A0A9X3NPP0_9ACTN|nr:AI-2E family transporter [Streptomonospora mangrovi]MDA0567212.1 AI-2E family transporter [Streptomonospora mangrovi]
MRFTSPRFGALLRRRRVRREPPEAPPPVPAEPVDTGPEESLLSRMGTAAWQLLVIGIVLAFIVYGLVYVRVVTIPVILAVFVTALLMPPTNWLRRRGLGRGSSTTIAIIGSLILLGGVVTLIVQPAISGVSGLVDSVQQAIDDLPSYLQALGLDPALAATTIEAVEREFRSMAQEDWSQWISQAWVAGATVLEFLVGLILIIVLTVYFVHSGDLLMEWLRSLFPARSRRSIKAATEISYGVMGRYVRGVALVGLIDAVGIGLFLLIFLDPGLAIPLIVLTFVGAFLPVIGAFLSGLLAAMVALVTEGWIIALVVVAAVVVVQQLESHVFAPRVYGKALELPSAVVLLAITLGSILGGIAGAFLATPIAAVIAALLRNRPLEHAADHGITVGAGGRPGEVAADRDKEKAAAPAGGEAAPGPAAPAGPRATAEPAKPAERPGEPGPAGGTPPAPPAGD